MNKQIFGNLEHIFHKNSWRIALVFVIIGLLGGLTSLLPKSTARTIEVVGEGRSAIAPDKYTYNAFIEVEKLTSDEAQNAVSVQVALIRKLVGEAVLADSQFETVEINVTPKYSSVSSGMKVSGYLGQQSILISSTDRAKLLGFSSTLTENGATRLVGPAPVFSSEKSSSVYQDTQKKALADAKNRATLLAKESGNQIGEVLSISQKSLSAPAPTVPLLNSSEQTVSEVGAANQNEIVTQIIVVYILK